MINKFSIKRKLLIYNVLIQGFILIILSFSIYKTLHLSSLDKMESSLKVIILDIADDIMKQKNALSEISFNEESEYKYKPLYIRLLKIDDKLELVSSTSFPKTIPLSFQDYPKNIIYFQKHEKYVIGAIKFMMNGKDYVLQVATGHKILNETMENLFYILIFIIPIVLILSIIGGYFLVYKSFAPIEKILWDLKNINASNLSKRLKNSNNNDEIDLLGKEINNLLERLEISFEKINQFSSDASHELKTPLTIIRGEIEIALRKERSTKEYEKSLQNCMDEVLIIQQTIDDLLFLAKSEDTPNLALENIYCDEVSLEAVKELKPYALLKSIHIKSEIKEIFQIKGYSKLLKIAIKNILKNAISFSHENSDVYIKNYIKDDKIIISIEDRGIGISDDEQEKIFEKFYRSDKSRNKESGGTGLGMSIAKKIIDFHNGEIKIESKQDLGTKIYLIFKGDNNEYQENC